MTIKVASAEGREEPQLEIGLPTNEVIENDEMSDDTYYMAKEKLQNSVDLVDYDSTRKIGGLDADEYLGQKLGGHQHAADLLLRKRRAAADDVPVEPEVEDKA